MKGQGQASCSYKERPQEKENKIKKECSHVFCKSDYLVHASLV